MVAAPQIVVEADTDKVLGMHMVGDHAAEIMQVRYAANAAGAEARRVVCGRACGAWCYSCNWDGV